MQYKRTNATVIQLLQDATYLLPTSHVSVSSTDPFVFLCRPTLSSEAYIMKQGLFIALGTLRS